MARYLALVNFTDQGIRDIKDSVHRAGVFRAAVEAAGGKVAGLYWALGAFDGAVLFETPDDATTVALMLSLGREGYVRTQTLRLLEADEFTQKVLTKVV